MMHPRKNIIIILFAICVVTKAIETRLTGNIPGNLDFSQNRKGSRVLPCPDPEMIFPCVCIVDSGITMDMDCSDVTSNDQLKQIFSKEFPFRNFRELRINDNYYLKTLRENDLGEVTFEHLHIWYGVLEMIEPNTLTGSRSTLKTISINSELISFPFEEIPIYTQLTMLDLDDNVFSNYPTLVSPTLKTVVLGNNNFTNLPYSALDYIPNIETFVFYANKGIKILPGTFTRSSHLRLIILSSCDLQYIPAEAFRLNTTGSVLGLSYNNISTVEVNAIQGVTESINLSVNSITELKEEVWQPVIANATLFDIEENPLLCGCDIAWLILSPEYMDKLDGGETCSTGELLTDLDPSIYDLLCY